MKQIKHTHTCMHAGACVHTHTHTHTNTHTHTHTHAHTHTHTHTRTHAHTHTHTQPNRHTHYNEDEKHKEKNQMKERQLQTEGSTDLPLRFQCLQHGFLGILVLLFLHLFIMLKHQSTATSSPPFNACHRSLVQVQCCFSPTETRLFGIRSPGQPPRLSHSSWVL